jgi:hypothetical protein
MSSAERLVPSLPATMQKALKALLVADESLGASDIIERAGISERSYTRNIDELAAVGMVEAVGDGGHRKWQAWIIPWWSPLADVERPRMADSDENDLTPASRWNDVLYEIALDLGLAPDYELFAGQVDIDEVFAALPALNRWRGFVTAHYGFDTNAIAAPESTASTSESTASQTSGTIVAVEIGSSPANRQASLNEGT